MSVSKLAYVGANATDLAVWRNCGTEVLGLEIGTDSGEQLLYLVADEQHHRFSIRNLLIS